MQYNRSDTPVYFTLILSFKFAQLAHFDARLHCAIDITMIASSSQVVCNVYMPAAVGRSRSRNDRAHPTRDTEPDRNSRFIPRSPSHEKTTPRSVLFERPRR